MKIVGLECDGCGKISKSEREAGWFAIQETSYTASPTVHVCSLLCMSKWVKNEKLRLKELEEKAEDVNDVIERRVG